MRRAGANNLQTLEAAVEQQIKDGEVRDKLRPPQLGIRRMDEAMEQNLDVLLLKNLLLQIILRRLPGEIRSGFSLAAEVKQKFGR